MVRIIKTEDNPEEIEVTRCDECPYFRYEKVVGLTGNKLNVQYQVLCTYMGMKFKGNFKGKSVNKACILPDRR